MDRTPSANSTGSGATAPSPPIKHNELEKLSKENFNCKLRIFYLEERLNKLQKGGETDESLQQELLDQKVLLEEKQQELDQRNALLGKARSAIEGLNTDLVLCKAELEQVRNNCVDPEVLREKEIELEAIHQELAEWEEKDRRRLEHIVSLNNEIRDITEHCNKLENDFSQEKTQNENLTKQLTEVEAKYQLSESRATELNSELKHVKEEVAGLRNDRETLQNKLVENARSLGDQRSREADLMTSMQEQARHDEGRVDKLQEMLRECEVDRDRHVRSCAVAERRVEELEEKVDQMQAKSSRYEAQVQQLEHELARALERVGSEQQNSAAETKRIREEAHLESVQRLNDARNEAAELRGKVEALSLSREGAQQRATEAEKRSDQLARELDLERKEHLAQLSQQSTKEQQALAKLQSLAEQLEDEKRKRELAEANALGQLERFKKREQQLQQGQEAYATELLDKVYDAMPQMDVLNRSTASSIHAREHDSFNLGEQWDAGEREYGTEFEGRHEEGDTENSQLNSGPRPQPRRSAIENGHFEASHTLRKAKMSPAELEARLLEIKEIKSAFATACLKLEQKWQRRVKQFVVQLERSEINLERAEDKLALYVKSIQTLNKQSSSHARDQHHVLQQRVEEMRRERHEAERRADRMASEKEKLRDELTLSKEGCARIEGELRQARAELNSLRNDKDRSDKKLETYVTSQAVLEENNRVMALELEERGAKVNQLNEALQSVQKDLECVRDELAHKCAAFDVLESKLAKASKENRVREQQLRETHAKLDKSLRKDNNYSEQLANGDGPLSHSDDFERKMWRQMEETERAIRSSSFPKDLDKRDLSAGLLEHHREALVRSSDMFSEILVAVAALVDRTKKMLARGEASGSRDVRTLLQDNYRLAQDMDKLGRDVERLFQQNLESVHASREEIGGKLERSIDSMKDSRHRAQSYSVTRHYPDSVLGTPENRLRTRSRLEDDRRPPSVGRMSTVHKDMLGRLGRIKADLEETAQQLNFSATEHSNNEPTARWYK